MSYGRLLDTFDKKVKYIVYGWVLNDDHSSSVHGHMIILGSYKHQSDANRRAIDCVTSSGHDNVYIVRTGDNIPITGTLGDDNKNTVYTLKDKVVGVSSNNEVSNKDEALISLHMLQHQIALLTEKANQLSSNLINKPNN